MPAETKPANQKGDYLVDYEENLSTQSGTASQSFVNSTVPSVAGSVMMADHMLLQMRKELTPDQTSRLNDLLPAPSQ